MKRAVLISIATAVLAGSGVTAVAAPHLRDTAGAAGGTSSWSGLRAGVGVSDATWHVGAGAGQYASNADPTDVSSEWDPNVQHVKDASSYGVASRLSIRAIVLQDGKGDPPVALVKDDNYLAQDMLTRRVGQILAADGSKVTYDHILLSATHDHNSPYYSSPAAGVWLFQDVMDLRMFEYQARQMAAAIEHAEATMVPARIGATTVQFPDFQGNIAGQDIDAQGAPAGYPVGDNDHGIVVMRLDNMSDPAAPTPLATYVNYAEHGESLDGYDLFSADWLAPFQRFVDRATGVPTVFSQGSVGSAEGPYDRYGNKTPTESDGGDSVLKIWAHMGYAQAERGTHVLAEHVIDAWKAIGGADPGSVGGVTVQVPYQDNPTVTMLTHWVAGPVSHPYPSVGNCRTGPSVNGDPGVPSGGLPDCERPSDVGPSLPFSTGLWDQLKAAGVPIPDNYDVSSYGSVEENMRIKLQAVRIGDTLLASCSCEPQSDLIKNLESRTDDQTGNMWLGFDYASQSNLDEGWPGQNVVPCHPVGDGSTYDCPDPTKDWLFGSKRMTLSKAAFDHMEAEIHNDAAGWNDPSYAAQAGSEPSDITAIKGNFTHSELGAGDYAKCGGYALSVGLGHTGDYNGYTVSYREYEARDAYRKALTTYGPHTADYMVTNLVGMAANLLCNTPLIAQPTDPIATADEPRQVAESTLLGQISSAYYDSWTAQIPDSAGPAKAVTQPWDVSRFDATQFRWVGGDNWTDDPTVTVQRQNADGTWSPYADQSGEVQVFLDKPTDVVSGLPGYHAGTQQWTWRASFEAFDSYPRADVPGGQVPDGSYRFVVAGDIHTGGVVAPYTVTSDPFQVSPWTGITARDLQVGNGQASFVVDPIAYPRMPTAAHTAGIAFYKDDGGGKPGGGPLCKTCTFRPWASSGQVASAVVEVTNPGGHVKSYPASFDPASGRWVADVTAQPGWEVSVPAGGIQDTYGEVNGEPLTATA